MTEDQEIEHLFLIGLPLLRAGMALGRAGKTEDDAVTKAVILKWRKRCRYVALEGRRSEHIDNYTVAQRNNLRILALANLRDQQADATPEPV